MRPFRFTGNSVRDQPSRRAVLGGLLSTGVLCAVEGGAEMIPKSMTWILLGTGKGEGISCAQWDPATGKIGAAALAVKTSKPSYLARHPRLPIVYACNEDDAPAAAVSAFSLSAFRTSQTLVPFSSQPTHGSAPCYVSLDPTGQLLFAANYSGGSLAVFPVDADGRLQPAATVFQCAGQPVCGALGPMKDRQEAAHLHCATLSPDHRFVLACNLGGDTILAFPLHPGGKSPVGSPTAIPTHAGAGPRHVAFHPNGRWLYCINELDCKVVLYHWDPSSASLATPVPDGSVSILPGDAPASITSTGAEIVVSRDGRFAYTSTRFTDVLTVFSVDSGTGKLTQVQQLPCGGKTPRFFALDPTERWLLCGNQDSDTVSVFARDGQTGHLRMTGTYPATNPQCILWL